MVDYALVQPGQDTLLNGAVGGFPDMTRPPERLHVDHNNPVVTFNGQWKTSTDGTTRDSITVGDSVQFPFYGTLPIMPLLSRTLMLDSTQVTT